MFILLLFSIIRPEITPITDSDLMRAESLTAFYQKGFDQSMTFEPTWSTLAGDGKLLVFGYEPGRLNETEDFIRNNSGKIIKISQTGGNYLLAHFPDFDIEQNFKILDIAKKTPSVRYVEPCRKMEKCFIPNDTFFLPYQWDKWIMYADLIWNVTLGSSDVTVAVCDQGVDYLHPDLRDNFNTAFYGYDVVDSDPDPYPDEIDEAHGTHVAGIIGAVINNGIGVAGWAQVRLLSVRVLDEGGTGSDFDVAEGIRWATTNGAKIINLSLGGADASTVGSEAVQYAWDNGVLIFAASGNEGIDYISYPARYNQCIAVGALDQNNRIAYFSNFGLKQELTSPGVNIISTVRDSGYAIYDGTSMACPQASGVAALIWSVLPSLTNQRLRSILDVGAIDLGVKGRDNFYGYGLIDAYRTFLIGQQLATKDKIPGKTDKDLSSCMIELKDKSQNSRIYDIQGRKIEQISHKGIYFFRDGRNQKVKKVVWR